MIYSAPVCAAAAVFAPIREAYFFRDDFYHLFALANVGTWRFIWLPFCGHLLVLWNLIFVAMHAAFGAEPHAYFVLALVTHLVNVGLLTHLLRRITRDAWIAAGVALLWGIAPQGEDTLGWFSVYGQVLATTFILASLLVLTRRTMGHLVETRRAIVRSGSLAVAAGLLFGTGIAFAMSYPALAWLLLPRSSRFRRVLPLAVCVPFLMVALYASDYAWAYHVGQNLIIEQGAAANVGRGLARLVPVSATLTGAGLVALSLGWYYPLAWFPSRAAWVVIACWLVLALLAIGAGSTGQAHGDGDTTADQPRPSAVILAGLLVASSCYGLVVLGRSYFPFALLVPIGRYHYTALVGAAVATAAVVSEAIGVLPVPRNAGGLLFALVAVWSLLGWWRSGDAIDTHAAARRETLETLAAIDRAVDAAPRGSPVCIANQAFYYSYMGPSWFPGWAGVLLAIRASNEVRGRWVYFVEKNGSTVDAWPRDQRIAEILVAPGRCPPPAVGGITPVGP